MQAGCCTSSFIIHSMRALLFVALASSCTSRQPSVREEDVRQENLDQLCDTQQFNLQLPVNTKAAASVSWLKADPRDPDFIFGSTKQGLIFSEDFGHSWQTLEGAELAVPRFKGEDSLRCMVDFKNADLSFFAAVRQKRNQPLFCLVTGDRTAVYCKTGTEPQWQHQTLAWPDGKKSPRSNKITQLHFVPSQQGSNVGLAMLLENASGPTPSQKIFLMHAPAVSESATLLAEKNRLEVCEYSSEISILGFSFIGLFCTRALDFFALPDLTNTTYEVNDQNDFAMSELVPPLDHDSSLLIRTFHDASDTYSLFTPLITGIQRLDLSLPRTGGRMVFAVGSTLDAGQPKLYELSASKGFQGDLWLEERDMKSGASLYRREVQLQGLVDESGLLLPQGEIKALLFARSRGCWKLILSERSGSHQNYHGFTSCTEDKTWQRNFNLSHY